MKTGIIQNEGRTAYCAINQTCYRGREVLSQSKPLGQSSPSEFIRTYARPTIFRSHSNNQASTVLRKNSWLASSPKVAVCRNDVYILGRRVVRVLLSEGRKLINCRGRIAEMSKLHGLKVLLTSVARYTIQI